jgi:Zn-dependent peptidase ImmA (M78 family)
MYKITHLEQWIFEFYKSLEISSAYGMDLKKICFDLRVFLIYKEISSSCYEYGRFKSITLDDRLSKQEQQEDFFHELCHLLRHCGDQRMMPKAFKELQEAQATTFTMYAALPYFMLKGYDLHDRDIIYILSEDFCVTEKLVVKRLIQIRNRILYYQKGGEFYEGIL